MAAPGGPASKVPSPEYFTQLAAGYARQTGNSSATIFSELIPDIQSSPVPITSSSKIHDIGAGPGTAVSVLFGQSIHPEYVLISDNNAAMVAAAKHSLSEAASSTAVETKELDAQDLSSLPDASFSHNILNFSIFLLADAKGAVQHMHRTLKPDGGLAVITTWKRFPVSAVIHAAQKSLRPDLPLMPVPGLPFYEEGHLASVVASAGFSPEKTKFTNHELVIKSGSEQYDGLRGFMTGPFTKPARNGYTEEEEAKWSAAIDQALATEVEEHGGIRFQGWGVIAQK